MAWEGRGSSRATESTLREAGFIVSQPCRCRPSCFDLVARRGKALIFMKMQPDVGSLSSSDSRELRSISQSFSAASLLVGRQSREKPLEDDTVYARHDILAVTPKTFENVVLHNMRPLVQANPGGYYVEIDGDVLKRRRQELDLSIGELAEMAGISRRTIYGYERGMAKASVTAAYNLIWILGIPVAKPVNILEESRDQSKRCVLLTTARRVFAESKLLQKILRRFAQCHITTVKKAPFDFILNVPQAKTRIIGGIANGKEPDLGKRVDEILSVSSVVQAHPVLITEIQERLEKNITCISSEEFSKIKDPEDFIANIK